MPVSERMMKRLRALYARLTNDKQKDNQEYHTARKLFDQFLERYGLAESDFDTYAETAEPERLTWLSSLKFKKETPQWFKVLCWTTAEICQHKAIVLNNQAGCIIIGLECQTVKGYLEHAIRNMNAAFQIIKAYMSKIHEKSYRLGYTYGFRVALDEKLNQVAYISPQDSQALIKISEALVAASQALVSFMEAAQAADAGKFEERTERPEVKDYSSFMLGYHNGLQAFKLLLTK